MNKLILGPSKTNEGYTIFKNADTNMVNEIKNFKMPISTFSTHYHKNSKIVQVLNEYQNLCVDEKNEYFIASDKNIERYIQEDKLNCVNQKFNIVEAIKKTFGTLYNSDGYSEISFSRTQNANVGFNNLGEMMYSEIGIKLETWQGIAIYEKSNNWSRGMFCFLNEEGNIENRDYNIDIAKLLGNKPKTKEDLIQEIIAKIPDVPYENYGNKWFASKFAFVLTEEEENRVGEKNYFHLSKLEGSNSSYGSSGYRIKKPKSTIKVTKEHILQRILPLVNKIKWGGNLDLSKYITIEATELVSFIQKRVQNTKINEKKFDVFDFIKEEEVLTDEEVMMALQNIENSIDIPNNATRVIEFLKDHLRCCDLPSYSFNKGEVQEDHSNYVGLVKMPHDCNFTFTVCEGEAVELRWDHSVYETDIVGLELVE